MCANCFQLSSFKEFLNKLDQSLESTKECFFTIYHLVKSNIEQGIADGSLYGVESGEDEEDGPAQSNTQTTVLSTSDTVNPLVQQPETTSSTPLVNSVTSKVNSTLEAQKAYLALLQGQTKTERAEIERLLRQRNELAERLRTLRAAASDAVEPHDVREHSLDTSASTQKDTNDSHQRGSCELEPALFGHLEAKRRELADLKAQLALLRQAEDRMAALHGPSTKQNGANTCQLDVDSDTQERQARSQRPSPAANTLILKTCLSKSGMQEHNQLAKNDHSTSAVTQKLDTVTFQQPEATCISDNTERLYENMREARMRLEEQRVRSTHLTSAAPERLTNGLSEGVKNTAFVTCSGGGGASVATSQDRTTLATWGGSSPVPSSSRSPSSGLPEELEEATSAPDSLPAFLPTQPSTNHVEDITTNSALHRISPVKNTLSQKSTRSTERHTCLSGGLTQQPSADRHLLHPEDNNDSLISLPQLGQSPPPPIGHSRSAELHSDGNEPSNGFVYISENGTEPPTMQSYKAATGNQLTAVGEERLQRLEIAVSQLHQISQYLVLENTQLYTAVMQLMLHAAPAQLPQTLPVPLASSANVLSQTSQPDTCGSLAQPLLSTQCTLLQNFLTNGQLQPPSALPLGSLHRSWNPGLPSQIRQATQDHDQLQIAMANLMQQQISCLNAQNELQRLLRQQLQHRQQLVVNTGLQSVTSNQVSSQLLSPVSNPPSAPTSIPAASCAVGAADLLRSGVGSTLWVHPQSYGGLPPGITGTPSWPYLQPSQPPSSASGGPTPVSVAALGQPQLGMPPLIDLYGQLFAPPHASSFGLNQQTGVSGNPPSAIPDPINPMWIPPHSIAGRGFL
ncbi:hypothetical protein P879_10303 [Paragonimus westermani]|uniref:Uncharacterized protein n=1 Tax=Paragonimus westermani TaxID=34504 RepID=A0A8T0D1G5_9TREM|nr:hypothetical protein P879_10303 [Paragonimus westermani]